MAFRNLLWWSFTSIAIFSTFVYVLFSSFHYDSPGVPSDTSSQSQEFRASKPNLWADLSVDEAGQVYNLLSHTHDFPNITTQSAKHGIGMIAVLHPNKTDAVNFLAGERDHIDRWAKAVVLHSTDDEALLAQYMVGPLPVSNNTQILPLTYPFNSGRSGGQAPFADETDIIMVAISVGENVSDITLDLLGGKTNPFDMTDPDAISIGARPIVLGSGHLTMWMEFYRPGWKSDASSVLPQGLYFKLGSSSLGPPGWQTKEWYYNGVLYPDLDAFRAAWSSPNFTKTSRNLDGSWTDTEDFNSKLYGRSLPPPLSVQPYGPRYQLDRTQNYIEWMGFSFYFAFSQVTAISLFDIRYNGESIMYHLGLQEALVHYAGDEPLQSGLEFLDAFFGMGFAMFSLVPGYDCPAYADYIDVSYRRGRLPWTRKNAICVFEHTSDAPLQRHSRVPGATVSRNTYLVLRSVSTAGNYDYTIDYIFYLDGSIEVKTRASGFIFTAYYDAFTNKSKSESENEYGYRVHDSITTSMHDHAIVFRADVDIAGSKNTFLRSSIEPLTRSYPWDKPEVSGPRNTMHLVHKPLEKETGLNWPRNSAELFLIQNDNQRNKWGETRAYRVQPGTGMGTPSHLTIVNSTTIGRSAAWSSADLWVLHAHDNEPACADPLNFLDPSDPLVDFEKMVDDENIVDQDVVLYFNLGGHHVPTTQDLPNTLMHTSASSVMFTPFNFFDSDVSLLTRQGVWVEPRTDDEMVDDGEMKGKVRTKRNAKEEDEVRYFGGHYEKGFQVQKEDVEPDLSGYLASDDRRIGGDGDGKASKARPGAGGGGNIFWGILGFGPHMLG